MSQVGLRVLICWCLGLAGYIAASERAALPLYDAFLLLLIGWNLMGLVKGKRG